MIIRSLKFNNFRNYNKFMVTLGAKMNIFIGDNGSGKTNILEAISILGLTKSFRNVLESDLIKFNKQKAKIEARISNNGQVKDLKIEFLPKEKDIYVNNKRIRKYADYLSNLNLVIFSPFDLEIIKGSPSIRRNLLNISLSQLSFTYLVTYNEYNKILKTRNEYLKILYTNSIADKTYLDILTDKLIDKAIIIYKIRYDYINKINKYIGDIYNYIADDTSMVDIEYRPNLPIESYSDDDLRSNLINIYKSNYRRELQAGMTLYGPHRDDFSFYLNKVDMKNFASLGQQKCVVLAYKLASIPIFEEYSGTQPVLLLDDIFSELDITKRNKVLRYINKDIQSIITTTDLKNISKTIIKDAVVFKVENGIIERS
ncbi:MAG TPA: DNA replication/repair protein RecF [Candidatus Onthousia faecavium]|nr:DNA replication/repair protein RecF [Candidatus Onthousia faecavium]